MPEAPGLLSRTRVVLVHPFFPENVGAVARSLHAFGLAELRVVEGRGLEAHPAAAASALAGSPLLTEAAFAGSLAESLEGAALVVAATNRHPKRRVLDPTEAAELALATPGPVVLLLGNEKNGLSDAEIALADVAVRIPTRPDGGSLNLAQAATVLAYAWAQAAGHPVAPAPVGKLALAQAPELEAAWQVLQTKLEALGLWEGPQGQKRATSLKRLLARSQPDGEELEALKALVAKLSL